MLIDCPACARSYHVSRAEIGAEGRAVVCPRCEAQWFVDGDGALASGAELRATSVSRRADTSSRSGKHAPRPSIWRRVRPALAAAICVVGAMGLLAARERIVRLTPRSAGLYAAIGLPVNVRGLVFANLAPTRSDDTPSDLRIAGEIRNVAHKRVGVPRLTYEIRDAAGLPLASWTERAAAPTLGVGKTLAFVSTPHRLPPEAHSVLVHFDDAEATPMLIARRSGT